MFIRLIHSLILILLEFNSLVVVEHWVSSWLTNVTSKQVIEDTPHAKIAELEGLPCTFRVTDGRGELSPVGINGLALPG
jgi:hypothetical protein